MLVLSRKEGQTIVISGGITIHVSKCTAHNVRLAIEAPLSVRVVRGELLPPPSGPGDSTPPGDSGDSVQKH